MHHLNPMTLVAFVVALSTLMACHSCGGTHRDAVPRENAAVAVDQPPRSDQAGPTAPAALPAAVDEGEMRAASRSSGAAPLAVVFDATRASSGVHLPSDGRLGRLAYAWDFDDAASGRWSTSGRPRNEATGFVAGHVFERPGRYTVTLRVEQPDGTAHLYRETVTVADPAADGWTAYYVASSGADANDGRSEAAPFRTVERALQAVGPRTRVLFRRGDTFEVGATLAFTADGPALIGAYGEGPKPVWRFASAARRGLQIGRRLANADLRFVDLELVGPGGDSACLFAEAVRMSDPLFLRLAVRNWGRGLVLSSTHEDFTGTAVVDCAFAQMSQAWGLYLGGSHAMILGNTISNPGGSHTVRIWYVCGLVMSHNVLRDGGVHTLKLHSETYTGDGSVSRDIVISHNDFGAAGPWTVAIGPENAESDERVERVWYESNIHRADADTEVSLSVWARDVMVVNNFFIGDGGSRSYTGVQVSRRGLEPPPRDVTILHNTFYRGDRGGGFTGVRIGDEAERTTVRNNLASAPGVGRAALISGAGTGLVESHNLLAESVGFRAPDTADFSLVAGSPAVDAGDDAGCRYDSAHRPRFDDPATTNAGAAGFADLGAVEYHP